MTKLFQAFLAGIFFTFILDFFIFLGIFLNYIRFYEIDVYYNILFWDYQNIFLYAISTVILGYIIIYINNTKVSFSIVAFLFLLSFSTLIHNIGYSIAEVVLMEKETTIKWKKYTYHGDIYYNGRETITFYDNELKKIILFNKKEINR